MENAVYLSLAVIIEQGPTLVSKEAFEKALTNEWNVEVHDLGSVYALIPVKKSLSIGFDKIESEKV